MSKFDDWYYQNDEDWLSSNPEATWEDENSENELRVDEWEGDWDWGELILVAICLDCGNPLTGYSTVFKFRFCEVCEVV